MPEQNKTKLLSPLSFVRIAWASTVKFSEKVNFDLFSDIVSPNIKTIQDKALKNEQESRYISESLNLFASALKNLNIIFKGRQLNYAENKKLREAYLNTLKEKSETTGKVKGLIDNLPGATLGGASGIAVSNITFSGTALIEKIFFGILFALVGYLVNQLISKYLLYRKQLNYIRQDYDTTLFYEHYLNRVHTTLKILYKNLEECHKNIFNRYYQENDEALKAIDEMINESRPTWCKYVHKHIKENVVAPELWNLCEIGYPKAKECPFYKAKTK